MARKSIGGRELELLRWLSGREEATTVGEAAEDFGSRHQLARSTVLTMMERLRAKGLLDRRSVAGVYRYVAVKPAESVARNAVSDFVARTLGGSIAPFVAYLSEAEDLEEAELEELERLLESLRDRRGERS